MTLAERLRAVRKARGFSQEGLAEKSGVSLRNISKIEYGHRDDIRRETAEKLSVALGCSIEWLLLESGDKPEGIDSGAAA